MFSETEISLLKNELSKYVDNYIEEIRSKTRLTYPTINKFFKGEAIRPSNEAAIYETGVALIEEHRSKHAHLVAKVKEFATDPSLISS